MGVLRSEQGWINGAFRLIVRIERHDLGRVIVLVAVDLIVSNQDFIVFDNRLTQRF